MGRIAAPYPLTFQIEPFILASRLILAQLGSAFAYGAEFLPALVILLGGVRDREAVFAVGAVAHGIDILIRLNGWEG